MVDRATPASEAISSIDTSVVPRWPKSCRATSMTWSRRKSLMTSFRSSEFCRPISAADPWSGAEGHRDVFHPVDERRLQPLDLAVQGDVGNPVEQVLEHDPDLHPGQVGPQAEV